MARAEGRPLSQGTGRLGHIPRAKPRANSSVRIIESAWEFEGSGSALSGFSVNHAQVENFESDQREDSAGESSGRCFSGAVCARSAIWRSASSCSAGDSTKRAEGILPTRKTRIGDRPALLAWRPTMLPDIALDLRRRSSNSTVFDSCSGRECEPLVGGDDAGSDAGWVLGRSAVDARCRGAGLRCLRGAVDAGPETFGRHGAGAHESRVARRPVPVRPTGCEAIGTAIPAVSRGAEGGLSTCARCGADRTSGAGAPVNPYALRCGAASETDGRSAVRILPERASRSNLATPRSGPANGRDGRACECARKPIAVARPAQRFGHASAAAMPSGRVIESCDCDPGRRDIAGVFAGMSWTAADNGAAMRVESGQFIRSQEVCEISGPGAATFSAVRPIHSCRRGIFENLPNRNPRARPHCDSANRKFIRTTKQADISSPRAECHCATVVLRAHRREFLNFGESVSRNDASCAVFALFPNIHMPERVAISCPNGKSNCAADTSSHPYSIICVKAEFYEIPRPRWPALKHIRRTELSGTSSPAAESRCAADTLLRFRAGSIFEALKLCGFFARFDLGEKHIRRGEVSDTSCPCARCVGFSGSHAVCDQSDGNFFIFCEFWRTIPLSIAASKYIRKTELFDTSCSGAARAFGGKSVSEDFGAGASAAVNSGECLTGINIQKSPDFSKVISQADSSESITGIDPAILPDLAIPHFSESVRGVGAQASFVSGLLHSADIVVGKGRRLCGASFEQIRPVDSSVSAFPFRDHSCRNRNVRNVARAAVRVIQVPQPLAIPGSIP